MAEKPKVLVGVTGSIAAYKAVELVRRLQQNNADVWVILTTCATQYIGPLTFRALTGHPVAAGGFAEREPDTFTHLGLTDGAAALVIAPCSAHTLARLAHGLADDVLSAAALSLPAPAPLIVAPAMNTRMWLHPATQANVALLQSRGTIVVPPGTGPLACGDFGPGRLADLEDIWRALAPVLAVR